MATSCLVKKVTANRQTFFSPFLPVLLFVFVVAISLILLFTINSTLFYAVAILQGFLYSPFQTYRHTTQHFSNPKDSRQNPILSNTYFLEIIIRSFYHVRVCVSCHTMAQPYQGFWCAMGQPMVRGVSGGY